MLFNEHNNPQFLISFIFFTGAFEHGEKSQCITSVRREEEEKPKNKEEQRHHQRVGGGRRRGNQRNNERKVSCNVKATPTLLKYYFYVTCCEVIRFYISTPH